MHEEDIPHFLTVLHVLVFCIKKFHCCIFCINAESSVIYAADLDDIIQRLLKGIFETALYGTQVNLRIMSCLNHILPTPLEW